MSMSTSTTRLQLPLLAAGQAQKHVTHNEALHILDAVVQASVADMHRTTPPASPAAGERHLVAAAATGSWTGHAGEIAVHEDGGWTFLMPRRGWRLWVADIEAMVVHDGTTWSPLKATSADRLGINAMPDIANRLVVSSEAVLLNHAGSGHQLKINKAASADTASLLFQSGFSGRAEMGIAGSDNFAIKVSGDGGTWRTALSVDAQNGHVRFPGGIVEPATGLKPMSLLPGVVKDIWRSDIDAPPTPRLFTVAAVSGTTVTLTAPLVEQIFGNPMQNCTMVRIWNTSKSPAQAAWVDWNLSATELRVSNAAHIVGWLPGETLRLGDPDPTGTNTMQMVALDLSNYLFNSFGAVFPQRGLKLMMSVQGVGGRVMMDNSGKGATGTALSVRSEGDGSRQSSFMDVFTTEPSPISNSNLFFVRESLVGGTALGATRLIRLVGVWV